jgi:hypothetical protein
MSVQDETWDRPVCNHCGYEIKYGEKYCHYNGDCLTSWKPYLDAKNMSEADLIKSKLVSVLDKLETANSFDSVGLSDQPLTLCEQLMNTQTIANINQSASEITTLIETLGFVTENPVLDLELQIGDIIKKNLLGNTNYTISPLLGIPPDDLGYPRFISCGCNKA